MTFGEGWVKSLSFRPTLIFLSRFPQSNSVCLVGCEDSESFAESSESNLLQNQAARAYFMAKRRGNPNWGKPEPIGPIVPTVTEFEQVVKEYKLTPDQYLRSTRLREWARRNKNSKYIPEPLLEAWGFEIESTL